MLFPGSADIARRFQVGVIELDAGAANMVNGVTVTPFLMKHACGAPPFALRLECDGKSLAYTGDTEWVDALIPAAREADLFIAEAYFWERKVKYHLDWVTLKSHLGEIRAKNTADGVTREQRDVLSESRMREICMSGSMPSDPDAYERGYAWPLHRGQRWGRP